MYKKRFILIIVPIFLAATSHAQDIQPKKIALDFGGGFGAFIPISKSSGMKSTIGSNALTYLQLTYKNKFFTKLQLGQTTVNYKSLQQFGTLKASTDSKINSTNIGLDFGYQHQWKRWQPYAYVGAGAAFMQTPTLEYNAENQAIAYKTKSINQLYLTGGIGANYVISPTFIIFVDLSAFTVPSLPKNSLTHLDGISPIIGIKAVL